MSYDQGFLESYYRGPAYTEPPKKEGDKPKNKPGKPLWDTYHTMFDKPIKQSLKTNLVVSRRRNHVYKPKQR